MEPTQTPAVLVDFLISELHALANPENVAGMSRFGISAAGTLGVSVPTLRTLARNARRSLGNDPGSRHELALLLWESAIHEARIMATLVDHPAQVTDEQMESWVADLDSWDVCDLLCNNLLRLTDHAWEKAEQWSAEDAEFTKRAGFVLGATLAVHDKTAPDERFLAVLAWIEREATDERNAVKKGMNWALRQVGKRSPALNPHAITTAERILSQYPGSPSARWITRDALRELRSDPVRQRLGMD